MKLLNIRKICATLTIMFAVMALIISATMFVGSLRQEKSAGASVGITPAENAKSYFYDQLVWNESKLEAKFYDAIKKMWEDGNLKTGNASIDLVASNILTQKEVDTYATNSMTMLYAFGAGKDAFYLDHPEVFYVNFDKMSIRTLSKEGKNYAFLGTGRTDSYSADGAVFQSAENVDKAINDYKNVYSDVIKEAGEKASAIEKVKVVYDFVRNKISYKTELDCGIENLDYVRNPYALVSGEGVCEAYARSFKIIMDELNIPCISIIGMYNEYSNENKQEITLSEPHMWNYVQIEGVWYLVDTTMDSKKAEEECEYFLAGYGTTGASHVSSQVISQSNYSFRYPELCNSKFEVVGNADFAMTEVVVDNVNYLRVTYKGMNGEQLYKQENKFFVANYINDVNANWAPLTNYTEQLNYAGSKDSDAGLLVALNGDFSKMRVGVTSFNATNPPYVASNEVLAYSEVYENQHQVASNHKPFPISVAPKNTEILRSGVTYNVVLTFDEELKAESGKSVSIEVTHNAGVELDDIKISNVAWDNQKTVTCQFTTSSRYAANTCAYKLFVKGLVSAQTGRECMPAGFFVLNQTNVGCPIKWGQTYEIYGKPQILETPEIDTKNWVLANGETVNKSLSNGIVLVVNEHIKDTVQGSINTGISADLGKTDQTVLASKTYDVSLTLCGQQVKNLGSVSGKRVKIMLPFPEGYSGKEAGVTFKAYHYSTVTSQIEEVDCLINENGIVIFCNEFSPFTVVATQKLAGEVNKTVGVLIHEGGVIDKELCELSPNSSQVFSITPNAKYVVDFVRVNGVDKAVVDNKFTITYEELKKDNSIVEVYFASVGIKQKEENEGYLQIIPTAAAPKVSIVRYVDTLSAVVSGVVGKLTYQWYMDGEMIIGATGKDYLIELQNDNKVYTVEVTNSVMSSTATVVSEPYQKVQNNEVIIVLLVCVGVGLLCVVFATMFVRRKNAKNKSN